MAGTIQTADYREVNDTSKQLNIQGYAVVNITGPKQRPNATEKGFRVLGFFSTVAKAKRFVSRAFPGSDCAIFVTPTHKMVPILESFDEQKAIETHAAITGAITKQYLTEYDANARELTERVKQETQSEPTPAYDPSSTANSAVSPAHDSSSAAIHDSAASPAQDPTSAAAHDIQPTSAPVPNNCVDVAYVPGTSTVAGLSYAVVSVVQTTDHPPAVAFLAGFATEADAKVYATTVASKAYPKMDKQVLQMYEFVYIGHLKDAKCRIPRVYGDRILQEAMDSVQFTETNDGDESTRGGEKTVK
jgi:hypothetical protein